MYEALFHWWLALKASVVIGLGTSALRPPQGRQTGSRQQVTSSPQRLEHGLVGFYSKVGLHLVWCVRSCGVKWLL